MDSIMDISSFTTEDIKIMSYKDMVKLCKEKGLKTGSKKKVDLQRALRRTLSTKNEGIDSDEDNCDLAQITNAGLAARKRRALSDISDLAGNPPDCKVLVKCDDTIVLNSDTIAASSAKRIADNVSMTISSSLFGEFDQSLRPSSSTPLRRIDSSDKPLSYLKKNKENDLATYSHTVTSAENHLRQLLNKFEAATKPIFDEISKQRSVLNSARTNGENYLKKTLDSELHKKEAELKSHYADKIEEYETEIREMRVKCGEQEFAHLKSLEDITNLRIELTTSESRVKEIEAEMQAKQEEHEQNIELLKTTELTPKEKLISDMEDELTCIICQELFLSAMTVPCGHSFCEICLRTWFKTKKTCPVCRRDVKLKVISSVLLDSAVERIAESFDEESKRKRVQLKRERNEQKRTEDALLNDGGIRAMFHRVDDATDTIAPLPPPRAANQNNNNNRRRSRSQSPTRAARRFSPARNNQNARNNQHGHNNNHNHHANNYVRQWNNYDNRPFYNLYCYRCGMHGHHVSHCRR